MIFFPDIFLLISVLYYPLSSSARVGWSGSWCWCFAGSSYGILQLLSSTPVVSYLLSGNAAGKQAHALWVYPALQLQSRGWELPKVGVQMIGRSLCQIRRSLSHLTFSLDSNVPESMASGRSTLNQNKITLLNCALSFPWFPAELWEREWLWPILAFVSINWK